MLMSQEDLVQRDLLVYEDFLASRRKMELLSSRKT